MLIIKYSEYLQKSVRHPVSFLFLKLSRMESSILIIFILIFILVAHYLYIHLHRDSATDIIPQKYHLVVFLCLCYIPFRVEKVLFIVGSFVWEWFDLRLNCEVADMYMLAWIP